MFEVLEKTNERVQLDRPFLIREKMQVIMLDSEKQNQEQAAIKLPPKLTQRSGSQQNMETMRSQ